MRVILAECPEALGPCGAREIGMVPTVGAVAAALCGFDDVWRDTLPMKNAPPRARAGPRRWPAGLPAGS